MGHYLSGYANFALNAEKLISEAEKRANTRDAEAKSTVAKAEEELAETKVLLARADNGLAEVRMLLERSEEETRKSGEKATEEIAKIEAERMRIEAERDAGREELSALKESFEERLTAARVDAVAAFRRSKEFSDEKVDFSCQAYMAGKQKIWDRLRTNCPNFDFSVVEDSSDSSDDDSIPPGTGSGSAVASQTMAELGVDLVEDRGHVLTASRASDEADAS